MGKRWWRKPRSASQRGADMGEDIWEWRWVLLALLVLAVLGKLAEALGLI